MSDHGSRLNKGIRSTKQGKLEDRLPMLYVAMPSWFKDEYPVAWANLNSNSERLVSAFDVHETFRDFIYLDNLKPKESVNISAKSSSKNFSSSLRQPSSLFQQLSPNRTCAEAGIPMHWCVCFEKTSISLESEDAKAGATFVVGHINQMLQDHYKCSNFSLSMITEAFEVKREEIVWRDSNHSSLVGMKNDMIRILTIEFETTPGDAKFEATVIKVGDEWGITEKPARINSYEGQSDCVEQEYKPFCYCET